MTQLKPGKSSAMPLALLLAMTAISGAVSVAVTLNPVWAQSTVAGAFPLPATVPSGTQVAIASSSSIKAINQALRQRFSSQYAGTNVTLNYVSTDAALQALQAGTVDIGAIGRSLTTAEKAQGLVEVPLTRHKIAAVVSIDNPFSTSLTTEQFAGIFQGSITDWSQVGRAPGAIRSVDRPDSSDIRQSLQNYAIFRNTPVGSGVNVMKLAQDNTDMMVNELGRDGIGYAIAEQVVNRPGVKILPIYDILPSDPRYAYSQPLVYVYRGANPSEGAKAFLGFATDVSNRAAIEAARLVDATTPTVAATTETNANPVSAAPATAPVPVPESTAAVPGAGASITGAGGGTSVAGAGTPVSPGAAVPGVPDASNPTAAPFIAPNSSELDQAAAPTAATADPSGQIPWWVWWLAFPVLGGLLWWLIRGDAANGPLIPAAAAADTRASRLILTPCTCQAAYAYWELSLDDQDMVDQHPGQSLSLRLYDVTDLDPDVDQQIPPSVQEFSCNENEPDRHVPIAVDNRDYVAELGILSSDKHWIPLARSPQVRVPACHQTEPTLWPTRQATKPAGLAGTTAIATATAATVAAAAAAKPRAAAPVQAAPPIRATPPGDRLILVPRNAHAAYAYWEVVDHHKAALKQQGGQTLALRLYDVTGLELNRPLPTLFQQVDCDDAKPDRHLSVPKGDRDYIAQLGYVTAASHWLQLAQSDPVHVPLAATKGDKSRI